MREEGLEGTLVDHGDKPTLHAASEKLTGELQALRVFESGIAGPTARLGVDVRKQLRKRSKFDETVKRECHGIPVFRDDGRWRDKGLEG